MTFPISSNTATNDSPILRELAALDRVTRLVDFFNDFIYHPNGSYKNVRSFMNAVNAGQVHSTREMVLADEHYAHECAKCRMIRKEGLPHSFRRMWFVDVPIWQPKFAKVIELFIGPFDALVHHPNQTAIRATMTEQTDRTIPKMVKMFRWVNEGEPGPMKMMGDYVHINQLGVIETERMNFNVIFGNSKDAERYRDYIVRDLPTPPLPDPMITIDNILP